MNIKQFLSYRTNCLVCGNILSTTFESRSRKLIRCENNRMVIQSDLTSLKKKKENSAKIFYNLGIEDNSFFIDFANSEGKIYNQSVPLSLIEKYKEYDKNTKSYRFYRGCISCCQHVFQSEPIFFDHKKSSFTTPVIYTESLNLSRVAKNNTYKVYFINNNYISKTTSLTIKLFNEIQMKRITKYFIQPDLGGADIELSLLKFDFKSKEQFMDKIDKLMLFS